MRILLLSVLLASLVGVMLIPNVFAENVPSWIKNNAGWWADGQIDDGSFLQGIQYLIKEGIMIISPTETSGSSNSQEIPSWIKNNAGWWADGQIDDGSFVLGIQWLISNGIIIIDEKLIPTDTDLRIAFIGDQGIRPASIAVLNLIKDEGAHMVLHQGDLYYEIDYRDATDTDAWEKMISDVLGDDFPYFITIGGHDVDEWNEYQQKAYDRLKKNPDAECTGDLGVKSFCTYRGLFFVQVGPDLKGSDHSSFIEKQLNGNNHLWRICSWAKNMTEMQIGGQENKVGWEVYTNCKNGGAIIATAHEHSYQRTKTLIDIENQIVDPEWSKRDKLRIKEDTTFVFVSGMGGWSIRGQERCLPISYPYGCNGEWASIYTTDQDANYGALFCTFNVGGQPNKAYCYFKNIDGAIIDAFTITNFLGTYSDNTNLSNFEKSGMDLTGNDFSNMVIIDGDLSNTTLVDANLSNSVLIGTTLRGADLTGANLTDVILKSEDITGAILRGVDLTGANIAGVDLSGKDLTGTILRGADLTGANLDGVDLSGRDLTGTILRGADLTNKNLTGTILKGADLTGANLDGVDLSGRDLTGTILRGADLTNKNLTGTILKGADLTGANIAGVDLSGKDLTGTILRGADLTGANLAGVDLSGKDLTGTILRGVDLTGVNINNTILSGADLTDVEHLPSFIESPSSWNDYLTNTIDFRGKPQSMTILDGINLSGKDLSKLNFEYTSLKNANLNNTINVKTSFLGADLTGADLSGADLGDATFAYSDLSGVNLSNAVLDGTNFKNVNFTSQDFSTIDEAMTTGTIFINATLANSNFEGIDLSFTAATLLRENEANFEYAKDPGNVQKMTENVFGETANMIVFHIETVGNNVVVSYIVYNNFAYANLENTNFKNANLKLANFGFANLTNADLSGADLSDSNLRGADLSYANLSGADLTGVVVGENTILNCKNHPICLN